MQTSFSTLLSSDYRLFTTRQLSYLVCFVNDTATTEIYTYLHTLSLHDALPISRVVTMRSSFIASSNRWRLAPGAGKTGPISRLMISRRSEEHTSELQSLMRISYAVFCLKKKKTTST